MPYAHNYFSRNASLYGLGDDDKPRGPSSISHGWTASNANVEITLDERVYPMFFSMKISPSSSGPVSIQFTDVPISGVNNSRLNNYSLVAHALFLSPVQSNVTASLTVKSSLFTTRSDSEDSSTSLNPGSHTPVRTPGISVVRGGAAQITEAYGDGVRVKYTSDNSFKSGDLVRVYNTGLTEFNTTTNATVERATSRFFTVLNTTRGLVRPTTSYAELETPGIRTSLPFPNYFGEDLLADVTFTISGHEENHIHMTVPVIVDMNRIFASWTTVNSLIKIPQVYIDIDSSSTPQWPMTKLIHSMTSGIEDLTDKAQAIGLYDASSQPGFVPVTDPLNKSNFVSPDAARDEYLDWLIQMAGQPRSRVSNVSNNCADYGADIKVRCRSTANVNPRTALRTGGRSVSAVSGDGTTVTYTTSSPHIFSAGDIVLVAGITTTTAYNGTFTIDSVPTTTTFTVTSSTTGTGTISGDETATPTIDGIVLSDGDRVLLANQTTANQNGIYIAGSNPTRWDGMPRRAAVISAVEPNTPEPGFTTFTALQYEEVVSTSGTVGTITGTGPWTATLGSMTGVPSTLKVGDSITALNGTGSLFGGSPSSCVVASIVDTQTITFIVTGGTIPTAGTVAFITKTASGHDLSPGDTVIVESLTAAHNGNYTIYSTTATQFVAESLVATACADQIGRARRAIQSTVPDKIFIREGTTYGLSMWAMNNATWIVIGNDSLTYGIAQSFAKVASTTNISITGGLVNGATVDGVVVATGDLVLLKDQTAASENGVWVVPASGPASRQAILPNDTVLPSGFPVFVTGNGTQSSKTRYTLDEGGTVNSATYPLSFTASAKPFAWDDTSEFKHWQATTQFMGHRAGSLESIEAVVKRYLIGDKQYRLVLDIPFRMTLYTLRDETLGIYGGDATQESELILNAVEPIRPAGFVFNHEALSQFAVFIIGDATYGIIGNNDSRIG